jgi:hypothetical protein
MAAFLLFVLAVAGGVVVADLVWENTAAGQVTVFHHAVGGYPVGWLLAIAAGLGCVVALLLVASMSSTKGRRARRKQLDRLRRGLEDRAVAPRPDHGRLLEEFFGPGEPAGHLGGPARPAHVSEEGRETERKTIDAGSQANGSSTPRAALRAGQAGRWPAPGLGPPGRGQPGAPAVAVLVEVRGGNELATTPRSHAARRG